MSYAVAGSAFNATLQQRLATRTRKPARPTRAIVRSHLSPVKAAEQARESISKVATAVSAAALLLVLPANAATPSLLEKGSSYQQELQDLISNRGSLPPLSSPAQAGEQKKSSADTGDFKLPNVAKTTIEAPQELDKALNQLPPPPTPTPDSGTPGQPKASVPKPSLPKPDLPKPDLPKPKLEAPKLDIPKPPKVEAPKPPSLPTPKPSFSGPQEVLPQQPGGGLPAPYLIAGGVAVAGIIGLGLAGASPDKQSPTPPATAAASKKSGGKPSGGSKPSGGGKSGGKGGLPEGKDPQLDSEVAKKKDPFFKNVKKRS